ISMSEDALTKNELYNFLDISYNEIAVAAPESTNSLNHQGVKSSATFQSGRIEVKENTYAEMKAKSVQYGMVNPNEEVLETVAGETTLAKTIELNEKDKESDSYPKLNEKVAEDMIGILTGVEEKSIQTIDHTESEMTIAKIPSEKESVQKVYASEEVSKKTIKREKVKKIKPTTQGKLEYLQAGAFRNVLNADKLKTKLAQNTKDVLVIESTSTGSDSQKLYKVLLGPIRSSEDRRLIINTLSKHGIVGFSVVI
ncbi:MAG: SPOR domain-containing protein, partial [Saprospiraceae bacterium]|nr:SPOR domain-containing protein [Saprospiraceae bacterium]